MNAPDVARILQVLWNHQVDYVLIGGQAALIHGATLPTNDTDILTRDEPSNLERLVDALLDIDAVSDMDQAPSVEALWGMNTRWITNAGRIDVLVAARGPDDRTINWNHVQPNAERVTSRGVTVTVVARDDLIAMKRAADRPHDHVVVEQLNTAIRSHDARQVDDRHRPSGC